MSRKLLSFLHKISAIYFFIILVNSTFAKDQWVFLGDSLTVGMIGDGSQLEHEVRQRWGQSIEVINKSRRGKHSYEYKKEIHQILAQYPRAQYFPIFCGVNDVLNYNAGSAKQLRGWLTFVLKAITTAGRTPILMRMTYRNYRGRDPLAAFNPGVYDPLIKKYSSKWYDYARNKGLIDPHSFIKYNPQYLSSDGLHLHASGYKALRKELILEKMMGQVYSLNAKDEESEDYIIQIAQSEDFFSTVNH